MESTHKALLELQELDDAIARAEADLGRFAPQLREVEAPLAALDSEIEAARARLEGFRQEAARLERAADQKRTQLKKYQDRMQRVRSSREESAARMELDLVSRAVDADEREALEQMDQATRTDLKLDDMLKQLDKRRAEVTPQVEALKQEQHAAEESLAELRDRRHNHAVRLDPKVLTLYDRIRSGTTRRALAPLTAEGACGNCYNILPVQEQSAIRGGEGLHRCEACGVLLYAE